VAFEVLPISNINMNYDFSITLDDVIYTLEFRYNYRAQIWILNIYDEDENPIYLGLPIQVKLSVTRQVIAYDVPEKVLLVINNLFDNIEATRDTFSQDVLLMYGERD